MKSYIRSFKITSGCLALTAILAVWGGAAVNARTEERRENDDPARVDRGQKVEQPGGERQRPPPGVQPPPIPPAETPEVRDRPPGRPGPPPPERPPYLRPPDRNQDEFFVLDRLLTMTPEQIDRVRRLLDRIDDMTPEEKQAMRDRLRRFREMDPEVLERMRQRYEAMTPEERREHIRRGTRGAWRDLSTEEREQLRDMEPEERREFFRQRREEREPSSSEEPGSS